MPGAPPSPGLTAAAFPPDIAPTVPVPLKVPPETSIAGADQEPSTWSMPRGNSVLPVKL